MKTTSAKATRLAVIITMFSLSVSISIPAPRAGDMIREAAKPAVTSPYPRLLSEIIKKSDCVQFVLVWSVIESGTNLNLNDYLPDSSVTSDT